MKIILPKTDRVKSLLKNFGFLKKSPFPSYESSTVILVKGQRWWEGDKPKGEEKLDWIDFSEKEESEIENKLTQVANQNIDFFDFLDGNLEVSVSLVPINIGKDKLMVSISIGDQVISRNVSILVTNALGQKRTAR